jgi:hypothetical protein
VGSSHIGAMAISAKWRDDPVTFKLSRITHRGEDERVRN